MAPRKGRQVICYTEEGVVIYDDVNNAAEKLGLNVWQIYHSISKGCVCNAMNFDYFYGDGEPKNKRKS